MGLGRVILAVPGAAAESSNIAGQVVAGLIANLMWPIMTALTVTTFGRPASAVLAS